MEVIRLIGMDDPITIIDGLKVIWENLPSDQLYTQMSEAFYKAEELLSADDQELCKRLDEEATAMYAAFITNLRTAVDVVQDYIDRFGDRIFRLRTIIPHVAKVVAYHKLITNFISTHS